MEKFSQNSMKVIECLSQETVQISCKETFKWLINTVYCRYKLMCDCWRRSPKERPSFSQALQALDEIISQDKDAEPYLELLLEECTKKEIGLELAPTSGVCRQESIDSDVFVD